MLKQRGRNFICKGICLKIYSFVEQSSARHVIKMFGLDFEQLFDDCIGGIWSQSKHQPGSPLRPIFGKLRQEKHGNIDTFVFSTHVIPDYISNIECWESCLGIPNENTTNYKQREGNYFTSYSSCVRRLSSPLCVFWPPESYNAAKTCCSLQSSDREGQMQILIVFFLILSYNRAILLVCCVRFYWEENNTKENQILTNGIFFVTEGSNSQDLRPKCVFSVCPQI